MILLYLFTTIIVDFKVNYMKIDISMGVLEPSTQEYLKNKIEYLSKHIPHLEYVILFGSYARLEQTISSDIDLLAITNGTTERLLRGDMCSSFEEDNIDLIFYDIDIFRTSDCLFVSQIKKEGIILWKRK